MRRAAAGIAALVAVTSAAYVSSPYARATSFVVRAAGVNGAAGAVAGWDTQSFTTEPTRVIPSRHGPLTVRLYRPTRIDRSVVLIPGLHPAGIQEPRLVGLARELAATGVAVLTVELPDLMRFAITPRSTDMIEDAASWFSSRGDIAADGRIGLIGISFAGGLAIVAAGRSALRDRLVYVLSFGGHGDLPRVLQYLCTGIEPDGIRRPPHDYGVAVVLLGVASSIVPPEQVDSLREGVLTYLNASALDMVDKTKAATEFARSQEIARSLSEPAATLLHYVNGRDVAALGRRLLPYVSAYGNDPALSPDRSPAPRVPVYLLHGTDDNVVPAVESILLARYLEDKTVVHRLLSGLITHAEVDKTAAVRDMWNLVAFWEGVLQE
jgi:dienelactone hydrolase